MNLVGPETAAEETWRPRDLHLVLPSLDLRSYSRVAMSDRLSGAVPLTDGELAHRAAVGLGDADAALQGAFKVTPGVVKVMAPVADAIGGSVLLLEVAEAGALFKGKALATQAALLLVQSSQMVHALRAVPMATLRKAVAARAAEVAAEVMVGGDGGVMERTRRVAGGIGRWVAVPSPPSKKPTGPKGALLAWAEVRAEELVRSGTLGRAPSEGGLGLSTFEFRVTGYFADSGEGTEALFQSAVAESDAAARKSDV